MRQEIINFGTYCKRDKLVAVVPYVKMKIISRLLDLVKNHCILITEMVIHTSMPLIKIVALYSTGST